MRILNIVWMFPLYSFLIYEIIKTAQALLKNISQIYQHIGIVMLLLPSFYFWLSLYTTCIIAPIFAMSMIWGFVWKGNEKSIKDRANYIIVTVIALFLLNTVFSLVEPFSYPLLVDSQGYERVRLFPFIPPVKH
jgi:hypothetical protein